MPQNMKLRSDYLWLASASFGLMSAFAPTATAELWVYPVVLDSNRPFQEATSTTSGGLERYTVVDAFGFQGEITIDYALVAEVVGGAEPAFHRLGGRLVGTNRQGSGLAFTELTFSTALSPINMLAGAGSSVGSYDQRFDGRTWLQCLGTAAAVPSVGEPNLFRFVPASPVAGRVSVLGTGRVRTTRGDLAFDVAPPNVAQSIWRDDQLRVSGEVGAVIRTGSVFDSRYSSNSGSNGARLRLIGQSSPRDTTISASQLGTLTTAATGAFLGDSDYAAGFGTAVPNALVFATIAGESSSVDFAIASSGGARLPASTAGTPLSQFTAVFPLARVGGFFIDGVKLEGDVDNSVSFITTSFVGGSAYRADDNGPWESASAWYGPVPNAQGCIAAIGLTANGPTALSVNQPKLLGQLSIDSVHPHTINGGGTLTLTASTSTSRIDARSASHTLNAPVAFGTSTVIAVGPGVALSLNGQLSGGGTIFKDSPGTLTIGASNSNGLYTGEIYIDAGRMVIQNAGGLGVATANGRTNVRGSGQLLLRGAFTSNEMLVFEGSGPDSTGAINTGGGTSSPVLAGLLVLNGNATIGVQPGDTLSITGRITQNFATLGLTKVGGGTLLLGGIQGNDYNGGTVVDAGTLVFAKNATASGTLSVNNGATVRLSLGGNHLLRTTGLNISSTSSLDLSDGGLVIDYAPSTPPIYVDVLTKILSARSGGTWSGPGITSSSISTGQAIGFGEAAGVLGVFGGIWFGQSVDASAILARRTLLGDSNLDGQVNISDFAKLAMKFNSRGGWTDGDFNYDATVSIDDFSLLAGNFNLAIPADVPRASAIPEVSTAFCAIGLPLAIRCRRRR